MKTEEAILLGHLGQSVEGKKIAKILGFLGVPWSALTTTEVLAHNGAGQESSSKYRLMCSSDALLRLIEGLERDPGCMQFWQEQVHSAFVYAGNDSEILQNLVRRLTGDSRAVISKINPGVGDVAVSDHFDDFCGVMAGMRVTTSGTKTGADLVLDASKRNAVSII